MSDLKQIIDTFLKAAIHAVRTHPTYQQAKEKGHLFFDLDKIKAYCTRWDKVLPSANELLNRAQMWGSVNKTV